LVGEVVRQAAVEVVALVVEKVVLDEELVVAISVVVVLDGAEPEVVLDVVLVVELGVLLRELDTMVEEEVGLVEVVVVVDAK
jgi:hypothetical protein